MKPIAKNMESRQCLWVDLGVTGYMQALEHQLHILEGKQSEKDKPDIILALEHPPVYTLGRRGGRENLTVTETFLHQKKIEIVPTDRGGNITYHGPGQLVVYPIIDLGARRLKVVDFVSGLEKVMVETAGDWGISAAADTVNRGVWIGRSKLGSIGIAVRRGISFHGMALNINIDLAPFSWINPCGFDNITMTSFKKECSRVIPMDQVKTAVFHHFSQVFNLKMDRETPSCLDKLFPNHDR